MYIYSFRRIAYPTYNSMYNKLLFYHSSMTFGSDSNTTNFLTFKDFDDNSSLYKAIWPNHFHQKEA